jgi:hypothetical protein
MACSKKEERTENHEVMSCRSKVKPAMKAIATSCLVFAGHLIVMRDGFIFNNIRICGTLFYFLAIQNISSTYFELAATIGTSRRMSVFRISSRMFYAVEVPGTRLSGSRHFAECPLCLYRTWYQYVEIHHTSIQVPVLVPVETPIRRGRDDAQARRSFRD